MEKLINEILNYVRQTHNLAKSAAIPSSPQMNNAAFLKFIQNRDSSITNMHLMDAIEEMDERGWVISRDNNSTIFDDAILR